ncbi:MAG TPA: nucleoside triphosphate pyrophosphohydrolase [bacterium]
MMTPRKLEKSLSFTELIKLVRTLRRKCPWDRRQTLRSLKNNVIEEAYELVDAIEARQAPMIQEEIGDILLLGVFLAVVFEQERKIPFEKLVAATVRKYRQKHPHVFRGQKLRTPDAVLKFWQSSKKDIHRGIAKTLPALLAARIIQERAAKIGFDWNSRRGPMKKINEELREIQSARSAPRVFEESGDLLFSCVNLCRHLGVDPEDALRHANKKFVKRFRIMKTTIEKNGKKLQDVQLKEMDRVWNIIKS